LVWWPTKRRKAAPRPPRRPDSAARLGRIGIRQRVRKEGKAMSMGAGAGNRAVPYINVTPLIDVLLVLLIIFMVVTPLKPSRFKADIPTQRDPNEDVSKIKPNPLTLVDTISTDLSIKLNQDSMGSVNQPENLAAKLQQTFQQRNEQHAYKVGMETASNVPEDQRIEKTA